MFQLSRIMGFARAKINFMQASLWHTAYFDLFEAPDMWIYYFKLYISEKKNYNCRL